MKQPVNVFWFRRDLRLDDNAGLYYALKEGKPVLLIISSIAFTWVVFIGH